MNHHLRSYRLFICLAVLLLVTAMLAPPAGAVASTATADSKNLMLIPCRANPNGNWGKVRAARRLKTDQELLDLLSNEGLNHTGHVGNIDLAITPQDIGVKFRSYGICEGREIIAAHDGEIIFFNWAGNVNGHLLKIRHPDGQIAWYAHLASSNPQRVGAKVRAGDVVATMGNTGATEGFVHLHFGVNEASDKGSANGTWKFVKDIYQINSLESRKALDIQDFSLKNGARLIQWDYHGGSNQRWVLEAAGPRKYRIRSLLSGKCLYALGGAKNDGTPIVQQQCDSAENKLWLMDIPNVTPPSGSTIVPITAIVSASSGKALDVPGGKHDNGLGIIQYSQHGGANQKWMLYPVSPAPVPAQPPASVPAPLPPAQQSPARPVLTYIKFYKSGTNVYANMCIDADSYSLQWGSVGRWDSGAPRGYGAINGCRTGVWFFADVTDTRETLWVQAVVRAGNLARTYKVSIRENGAKCQLDQNDTPLRESQECVFTNA